MSAPPLIVIFGAAVRPDGRASPALLRRIGYGRAAAELHPHAPILCSGGAVRAGPTEASLMAQALAESGAAEARLILDEASLDTLQNVEAAVRHAREGGHPYVVVCSDSYHLPRIRMMLALHGVEARTGPVPWGPAGGSVAHWIGMSLRELLAIPHTLARLLLRGRRRAAS